MKSQKVTDILMTLNFNFVTDNDFIRAISMLLLFMFMYWSKKTSIVFDFYNIMLCDCLNWQTEAIENIHF